RCYAVVPHGAGVPAQPFPAANCASFPMGSVSLKRSSGWAGMDSTQAFDGSYQQTSKRNATLTVPGVAGNTFELIATRCKGCGSVTVSLNGSPLQTISLAGAQDAGHMFSIATLPALESGTLTIKVASSGKPVKIEGIGVGKV